jgi:gamma-glutamyltranspeptidase/glutathione hydrolase
VPSVGRWKSHRADADDAYLAAAAKLSTEACAGSSSGNPVKGRHHLPDGGRRERHDDQLHPEQLHGLRLGLRGADFGISLQNRGHGFSLQPGANQVAPGKRPFHTIIPAFLTKDGQPVMSFGVMGGNMQPQGHMQTLVRMLDYDQNPQAACDAPRWRFNAGLEINVEQQMDKATVQELIGRGHRIEVINDNYQDFGAGQFIWKMGDTKKEGYVIAFGLAARRAGLRGSDPISLFPRRRGPDPISSFREGGKPKAFAWTPWIPAFAGRIGTGGVHGMTRRCMSLDVTLRGHKVPRLPP